MKPTAPIEIRTVQLDEIRYEERVIDVIAVPYNQWTQVEHEGRVIEESFAPGAFDGVQGRTDRFRVNVNLEHDLTKQIGRVQHLDPDHPPGLRAEIKVRRTDDGDQALKDADDGMLDASVGFGALPENQQWEGRARRRIIKAFLDHIALTWTPAYPGARVLAVRSGSVARHPSATPNLDVILAERLATQYDHRL